MSLAPPATPEDNRSLEGGLPLRILHRPGPAILAARLAIPGGSGRDPAGAGAPTSCWPAA